MRLRSATSTIAVPARALCWRAVWRRFKWLIFAWPRLTLPDAVSLNRFFAPEWVFILGMMQDVIYVMRSKKLAKVLFGFSKQSVRSNFTQILHFPNLIWACPLASQLRGGSGRAIRCNRRRLASQLRGVASQAISAAIPHAGLRAEGRFWSFSQRALGPFRPFWSSLFGPFWRRTFSAFSKKKTANSLTIN